MFYNNGYACCYDELITYYPIYYRDVREMKAILSANGSIADELQQNIEQVADNCFIDTADEATIARLEVFLNLGLNKTRTLEERRRLVKSFFVGFGKVSATMLKEMIASYTNSNVEIYFEPGDDDGNNFLYINFDRGKEETLYINDIEILLSKKIPAHIKYRASVVYRFPIVVSERRTNYNYGYDLCGTKPDTALLGVAIGQITALEQRRTNYTTEYKSASESETVGSQPMSMLIGHNDVINAGAEAYAADYSVDYTPCGTTISQDRR